ncbi:mechanosensitive ion channel family protein [Wenyingzhuangia sp. 2_MG-2023]|uniref:mechanosensitive ion channel family protein n=1 Tax=Wenyingzhuangia sp. 2_MG-2023 TaxID=3062639 RepID=UPI0026E1A17A|nr:mechanosensitive ion channel domain-containing protein [Wenyingzhuangia sp. 2_MG-2023]MDO6737597.1 mechanosensitive ion channel [Wenyingzhuangia sp. 2_MG-2023]MDO6802435.1 mechanosensitive ion channel [Wenyingzhuangia sp. 1_MG-2023]
MEEIDFKGLVTEYLPIVTEYAVKITTAVLLLIIGLWLIKKIDKVIMGIFHKSKIELSLQKFLGNLLNWVLKVLLGITILGQLGIATTSFIAILGAAGLAVGLALQGALGNFAGGALIMLFKPFKVDDLIEAQGELGVVKEIQIFVTKIVTPQNKLVIIPNGPLSNGNIKNYTEEGQLRVDLTIGIAYDADIKLAKKILEEVMLADPKVLKIPAPSVNVSSLGESSVDLAVRPFATPENYWDVYFGTLENCKIALDNAGIKIPFPQREVYVTNQN